MSPRTTGFIALKCGVSAFGDQAKQRRPGGAKLEAVWMFR